MLISFLKVVVKCVTVAYASKNGPSVFKHSVLACSNTVPQGCEVELEGLDIYTGNPSFFFSPSPGLAGAGDQHRVGRRGSRNTERKGWSQSS